MKQNTWLLPAGINEVLPEEAAYSETLRRRLINLYQSWGYELVIPPMLEYLDSMLMGIGHILELQTFKLTDQLTGRLMGVRADMTPQVARIDVHHLKRSQPTRLCYLGTVLHTKPSKFAGSRTPEQVGAELYGYAGIAADAEILSLMIHTLRAVGISDFLIDIGHVQIYRTLLKQAQLNPTEIEELSAAIKQKSTADLDEILAKLPLSKTVKQMFRALIALNGDSSVLKEARKTLSAAPTAVHQALDDLEKIQAEFPTENLYFDLAESRGYSYHEGVIFAAYVDKHGQAIAKGGRYDLGKIFGQPRPATGFSTNLRTLVSLTTIPAKPKGIFSPPLHTDKKLLDIVTQLRQQGEIVICSLPNQIGDAQAMACDRELRLQNGQWQIIDLQGN